MSSAIKSELKEVMDYLEAKGVPNTVKIFKKHGATEGPLFGVKVADLKPLQKKYKKNLALSLALFETNNSDAMYLAALIAEPKSMEKETILKWVHQAWWYMIREHAVAWTISESNYPLEIFNECIASDDDGVASTGWAALNSYISITPDEKLDMKYLKERLAEVEKSIHSKTNRVRYTMNGFVISLASYVMPLNAEAKAAAKSIGKVEVFMGETSCKVPFAPEYILKVEARGNNGKKRKGAVC
jgi:3-methyladenine DNA glycosylase AlkD